jgi:hypothetical protein
MLSFGNVFLMYTISYVSIYTIAHKSLFVQWGKMKVYSHRNLFAVSEL